MFVQSHAEMGHPAPQTRQQGASNSQAEGQSQPTKAKTASIFPRQGSKWHHIFWLGGGAGQRKLFYAPLGAPTNGDLASSNNDSAKWSVSHGKMMLRGGKLGKFC